MQNAMVFAIPALANYFTSVQATVNGPTPRELYDINSAFVETLLLANSFTFGMAWLALKYKRGTIWIMASLAMRMTMPG